MEEKKVNSHYCDKCRKPIMVSAGGTFCRFHGQELCRITIPHCQSCGKILVKKPYNENKYHQWKCKLCGFEWDWICGVCTNMKCDYYDFPFLKK